VPSAYGPTRWVDAIPSGDMERSQANASRFDPSSKRGHYESWFQRANHPSRPLAFWVRYTIFAPKRRPADARGELWAIVFDGERDEIVAVKRDVPIAECRFSPEGLDVHIGESVLDEARLRGTARTADRSIAWNLTFDGGASPLLLLPRRLYAGRFPKAKALVGRPSCRYHGTIEVGPRTLDVDGWLGSQNHNWGTRHTDRYAWGQVVGFDEDPSAFLECSTARIEMGPLASPWFTFVVVRLGHEELVVNDLVRAARAQVGLEGFTWTFDTRRKDLVVRGRIEAPARRFVGLRYANPSGPDKFCLNTKLARCTLEVHRRDHPSVVLETRDRAAFELLGDDPRGVPVVAG
jgi:hypothetical protein